MLVQLGLEFQTWITVLGLGQILLASAIAGLAVLGYLRNSSRPMLLLGTGIVGLTIAPVVFRYAFQELAGLQNSAVIAMSLEVVGLGLILSSIISARNARSSPQS